MRAKATPRPQPARARWMSILARATSGELEAAWERLEERPRYAVLRRPETGLVMVRGRAGGTGDPFNFGEMTVTRCAVRLADGTVGHCYAAGRDKRKAELAAVFDALMQSAGDARIEETVIAPLARRQVAERERVSRKAAATKVDFFTMVRGDNPG
ncbi:phosphonate C-P lyase system protein PhnG [Chelativorans alearense]|uniref:phosphonate C-P lyase system protein PhnG n=1 Tax=Chelativorans alearense TaxID=2681495 RepID=UPI00248469A2|nr:phosphonate C-P lyase system protein PhnG [Chelativorans alearense]